MGTPPGVVIIGAGFGGLWAAKTLSGSGLPVLIIDSNNFHTFQPLLYQVATAGIEPEDISYPIRGILRGLKGVQFLMANVEEIDPAARCVRTSAGTRRFEYLVIATGGATAYFNVPGAEANSFSLKTIDEAVSLRNHILLCFERAAREERPQIRKSLLTFAIVGGGATGIEFAGAFAELINGPVLKDYPEISGKEIELVLIESSARLIAAFPEKLSSYALARLTKMGARVRLGRRVVKVSEDGVDFKEGSSLETRTVVWLAGISGNSPLSPLIKSERDKRIMVAPTLQIADHPGIFALGDLAYLDEGGKGLPMVAPVAIQQGTLAARNILRLRKGEAPRNFAYHDKGTMVTIGRNAAIAKVGKLSLTGFIAWVLWLVLHLYKLIGFRNRLIVLINWMVDYFFVDRAIRIILPSSIRQWNFPNQ